MTSKETRRNPLSMATSQRLALSNKNKNWRANYLRALNIFTPDLETSNRGRHVSTDGRRTDRRRIEESRRVEESRREESKPPILRASSSHSARNSRSGSSTRSHNQEKTSTYVFGMRQHLFRARRPPRSDFMMVDQVSAPIEIPTGTSVTSPTEIPSRADKLSDRNSMQRRRGSSNDFQGSTDKQPMMQLLSWEEPSVMLGSGGWPLESEKRNGEERGRRARPYAGIAEEDTEDDELTNTENDDDDDIFKMEFDGEGSDPNAGKNVFRATRCKDRGRTELQRRRPEGLDDLDDDEENDVVTPLSASFVPPHQMVERGCFSLGLRDELKRKPGVHI